MCLNQPLTQSLQPCGDCLKRSTSKAASCPLATSKQWTTNAVNKRVSTTALLDAAKSTPRCRTFAAHSASSSTEELGRIGR
jgi:hypothetical protein